MPTDEPTISNGSVSATAAAPAKAPVTEVPSPSYSTTAWVALAVISLAYVAFRIWHMADICLDGDEIFSLSLARQSWSALTAAAVRDSVHPPLFYYFLKLWISAFGDSLTVVRALPAFFSALLLVPLILLCRELRLRAWETVTIICVASVHPMLLYYAHHARMYSLLVLAATASFYLFLVAMRRGTWLPWVLLTVVNIVLVYSQYFGFAVLAVEGLSVLIWYRRSIIKMIAAGAAVGLAFLPWYLAASHAIHAKGGLSSNLGWIQRPRIYDFGWFLFDMTGFADWIAAGRWSNWILLIIWLAIAWLVLRTALKATQDPKAPLFFMFLMAIVPAALAFAASHFGSSSVWGHRHLTISLIPFLILCLLSFRQRPRIIGAAVLVLLCASTVHSVYLASQKEDRKLPWDDMVVKIERAEMSSKANSSDRVLIYGLNETHYPLGFYVDELAQGKKSLLSTAIDAQEWPEMKTAASAFATKRITNIADAKGPHFWISYAVPDWSTKPLPEAMLAQRGCRIGAEVTDKDRFHSAHAFPVWCND